MSLPGRKLLADNFGGPFPERSLIDQFLRGDGEHELPIIDEAVVDDRELRVVRFTGAAPAVQLYKVLFLRH